MKTCEEWPPEKIVDYCRKNNIPSIAYTYNEPTIFVEYAYDTMKLAKKYGIKNVFISNGYESKETIEYIAQYSYCFTASAVTSEAPFPGIKPVIVCSPFVTLGTPNQ